MSSKRQVSYYDGIFLQLDIRFVWNKNDICDDSVAWVADRNQDPLNPESSMMHIAVFSSTAIFMTSPLKGIVIRNHVRTCIRSHDGQILQICLRFMSLRERAALGHRFLIDDRLQRLTRTRRWWRSIFDDEASQGTISRSVEYLGLYEELWEGWHGSCDYSKIHLDGTLPWSALLIRLDLTVHIPQQGSDCSRPQGIRTMNVQNDDD